MSETGVITIIVAFLGSSDLILAIFTIIQYVQSRKDKKKDRIKAIEDKLETLEEKGAKNELDAVRLQILVLLADYPDDQAEILRVAEHYFSELKGNWYMTSIFNKWLETNGIAKPEWFKD